MKTQIELNSQKEDLLSEIQVLRENSIRKMTELAEMAIGAGWECSNILLNKICFAVVNENAEEGKSRHYFGQEIEICRSQYMSGKPLKHAESFETNIASCGNSDIDKGDEIGDRAYYYIGLGKLLSNKVALSIIKNKIVSFTNKLNEIYAEIDAINKEIRNLNN